MGAAPADWSLCRCRAPSRPPFGSKGGRARRRTSVGAAVVASPALFRHCRDLRLPCSPELPPLELTVAATGAN
ncbi:hypothetical protein AHAS_Ahas05G0208900 [Arachis hypogaea]